MIDGDFIVVEGVNGVLRKKMVRDLIEKKLNNCILLNKKEISCNDEDIADIQKRLSRLMWPPNDDVVGKQLPFDYWLHLQICWFNLRTKFDINPHLGKRTIVTDNWYYSFFAKSLLTGIEKSFLVDSFTNIAKPDCVILSVVTDFDRLWEESAELKPSKFGVHQGFSEKSKNTFINYHKELQSELLKMAKELNWLITPCEEVGW